MKKSTSLSLKQLCATCNPFNHRRKIGTLMLINSLLLSVHSFGKGNVEHAFKKGSVTAYAGLGAPNWFQALSAVAGGTSVGPVMIGGQYHLTNNISIGLQYGNSSVQGGSKLYDDGVNSFSYKYKLAINSMTVSTDFYWLNRKFIAMYSGVNYGYVSVKAKASFSDNGNHTNLVSFGGASSGVMLTNFKLIGIKAKVANNLGVFGTLGIGTDGLVGFGLNYTFVNVPKFKS